MKRIITIILSLLFFISLAQAQHDASQGIHIGIQGGIGYGLYRDIGASPLTYRGLELMPGLSVSVWQPLWRFETRLNLCGGGYGNRLGLNYMQAYGGQVRIDFQAMRKTVEMGRWQLWAGASLDDRADIRYNSTLGNSCVGASNFINLNLIGRAEMHLSHWVLHGQLAMTPLSLLLRPGFCYMDNYDHQINNPLSDFMKQYQWYWAGATIVATQLGATLLLQNGNRVALSYRWHYLTSRATADNVTAPYTFEQAGHAIVFELGFKL
ncbi:MAG: hypothetical protein II555_04125 [Bacteroidales bacterium]|nr:hypothetical protein [Bacteroidales bacterium]